MITIPEMEYLPKNCIVCPFSFWDDETNDHICSWHMCIVEIRDGDKRRMNSCPLVEKDIISRTDLLDAIGHGTTYTSEDLQRIIKTLPSVNSQPNTTQKGSIKYVRKNADRST